MIASKKCYDLIKKWEGFSAKPYRCPAGVPTIGYGSTYYEDGRRVTMQDHPISRERASQILCNSVDKYEKAINRYLQVTLRQHQFDAVVSLVYNIGIGAFQRSTLLRTLNQNNIKESSKQFGRWVYADGKKLGGLINRRREEQLLFDGKLVVKR